MPTNIETIIETVTRIQNAFISTMVNCGGQFCSKFSQEILVRWYVSRPATAAGGRQPQLLEVMCEVLAAKWVSFCRQGGVGFAKSAMTDVGEAEIAESASTQLSFPAPDRGYAQFRHTEQMLAQAGLHRVDYDILQRKDGKDGKPPEGYEFLLPHLNRLRASAGRYCIIAVVGNSRTPGTVNRMGHAMSVDCVNTMPCIFDPDAGFASFTSTTMLTNAMDQWLRHINSKIMEIDICIFRSFVG
jgi:hypothetical protein